MNTLKVIIQLGCLVFLAAITLLLGHKHQSEKVGVSAPPAEEAHYKYANFNFSGSRIMELGQKMDANVVFYDRDPNALSTSPAQTNRVADALDALNTIADDGWQFVWTNGTNFITRRADGAGHHAYFILEYLPHQP